jgi:hypothetical protein
MIRLQLAGRPTAGCPRQLKRCAFDGVPPPSSYASHCPERQRQLGRGFPLVSGTVALSFLLIEQDSRFERARPGRE